MRLSIKDTWYTPGTDQISFGGSSSFSIDRWILDLYDLRDLYRVCWVGSVWSSSYTRLRGWHAYDVDLLHMFAWVGSCTIYQRYFLPGTCLRWWDLYDLHDLHVFAECELYDLRYLDHIYLMGSVWSIAWVASVWSTWSVLVFWVFCMICGISRSYFPHEICTI